MTSGSLLPPPAFMPNYLGANERQLALYAPNSNYLDSLASAPSNNVPATTSYEPGAGDFAAAAYASQQQPFDSQPQTLEQANQMSQLAAAVAASQQQQGSLYVPYNQAGAYYAPAPSNGFGVTSLQPVRSGKPSGASTAAAGTRSQFDTNLGHYSTFYDQQPELEAAGPAAPELAGGASDFGSAPPARPQLQQSQQQQNQHYGSYISGAPVSVAGGQQEAGGAYGRPGQDEVSLQAPGAQQQQPAFDQLPSASLDAPSYQKAPAPMARQQAGSSALHSKPAPNLAPRRTGAVRVKLDEAARSRLEQQLQTNAGQQNNGPQLMSGPLKSFANYNFLTLSSAPVQPAELAAGAGGAQQARTTRQEQQWLAPAALMTMTNQQQQQPTAAGSTKSRRPAQESRASGGGGGGSNSISTGETSKQQPELKWRQVAPLYQFAEPAGGGQQGEPSGQGQRQALPLRPLASEQGWKSLDEGEGESNELSGSLPPMRTLSAAPVSAGAGDERRFEYARGDEQQVATGEGGANLHRVSRTPSAQVSADYRAAQAQPSEENKRAGGAQRTPAVMPIKEQHRRPHSQPQLDHTEANEALAPQESAPSGHLFATNSIRNKSIELAAAASRNEVVKPAKAPLAPSSPRDNHDKTAQKSIDASASRGGGDKQEDSTSQANEDNKQSAPGDNVVVELIDGGGELLGGGGGGVELNQSAIPAEQQTFGRAGAARRSQQDGQANGEDNGDEGGGEQDGATKRAYRGLVAGSLGLATN